MLAMDKVKMKSLWGDFVVPRDKGIMIKASSIEFGSLLEFGDSHVRKIRALHRGGYC